MTTNHEFPVTRPSQAHAWLDGWSVAIDQPEHPAHELDTGGHSAAWLAGYHAGRAAVATDDDSVYAWVNGVDDPGDVEVHHAPQPNANALLHVPPRHSAVSDSPNVRPPVSLRAYEDHEHAKRDRSELHKRAWALATARAQTSFLGF